METSSISENLITVDSLFQKALEVGKNISEIKVNYPKTAFLLYDPAILDGDIENFSSLFAIGVAMGAEDGKGGYSKVELDDFLNKKEHKFFAVPEAVNKALDKLVESTSARNSSQLLEQVESQYRKTRARLMTNQNSAWEIYMLIERNRQQLEAKEELRSQR